MNQYIIKSMIVIFFLLTGCSKQSRNDYFPLAVGMEWNYSGNVSNPVIGSQQLKVVCRVSDNEIINGKPYYKFVTIVAGPAGENTQINYYRVQSDGVFSLQGERKDQPEFLYLPLPPVVGYTWTVKTIEGKMRFRVDALESVEMMAKSYRNCVKISADAQFEVNNQQAHSASINYFAPGIGQVKASLGITQPDAVLGQANTNINMSLTEFKEGVPK